MNKADLIEAVAIKCDISKLAAQRAVDAMIDTITNSLQNRTAKKFSCWVSARFLSLNAPLVKAAIFVRINRLKFPQEKFRSLSLAKI